MAVSYMFTFALGAYLLERSLSRENTLYKGRIYGVAQVAIARGPEFQKAPDRGIATDSMWKVTV